MVESTLIFGIPSSKWECIVFNKEEEFISTDVEKGYRYEAIIKDVVYSRKMERGKNRFLRCAGAGAGAEMGMYVWMYGLRGAS